MKCQRYQSLRPSPKHDKFLLKVTIPLKRYKITPVPRPCFLPLNMLLVLLTVAVKCSSAPLKVSSYRRLLSILLPALTSDEVKYISESFLLLEATPLL